MAWGQRKSARVQFEPGLNVLIMGIDGSRRRECLLFDISQTGARLVVSRAIEGLSHKESLLLLSPTGTVHLHCEPIRVNGDGLGVHFLHGEALQHLQC